MSSRNIVVRLNPVILWLSFLVVPASLLGQSSPEQFKVGFVLDSEAEHGKNACVDVRIATELLISNLIKRKNHLKPKFEILDSTDHLIEAVKNDAFDVVEINPIGARAAI
ncbi:MAG: hypothetical protein R3F19_15265 [Verrucomicrobiales bacterium]